MKLIDYIVEFIKERPWILLFVFGLFAWTVSAVGALTFGKYYHPIDIYGRALLFLIGLITISISTYKLSVNAKAGKSDKNLCEEIIKCGVKNVFRKPTESRQEEVKKLINEEVIDKGRFRLLAMSGYSYYLVGSKGYRSVAKK